MPTPRGFIPILALILMAGPRSSLTGQTLELAGNASLGALISDEGNASSTGGFGASVGGPVHSRHKIQFDYSFADVRFPIDSHFLAVSYVLQKQSPGVRPFFQIGAGTEIQKFHRPSFLPPAFPFDDRKANFALVFGGGASIDLGERFFIRPELRAYAVFGPAVFLLPTLTVGAKF